jgi:hypothetical protein
MTGINAEAAMPAELERPERLQIMLNAEELAAVDDFRFKRRMPSRAAAVRELMKRGLGAEGFSLAPVGERSNSFGVLDPKAARFHAGNGASDAEAEDDDEGKRRPAERPSRS